MAVQVRDFRHDDPDDAQLLADLYNDFDSAWPGGFTRGVPMTATSVAERQRRMHRLAILVADADGQLVGYCDLEAQPDQRDVAYVDLLGARLAYHGQGVGRDLLREAVRRAIAHGYPEVTLHTWAGNTKAVPLYKKSGFQWVPETDVYMRNFVPAILASPAGQTFFAARDWYACQVRDLTVAPDDARIGPMRVFRYGFRDGDDLLNVTIDAASGGITGIQTRRWSALCTVDAEETAAGDACTITWTVTTDAGSPVEVVLLAEGEPGLDLHIHERFTLAGERTVQGRVAVPADTPPLSHGVPARRVRTTLLIDGEPVELRTGVTVVRPVEVDVTGAGFAAGRPASVRARLRSRVNRPLHGRLTLEAHPDISCTDPSHPVNLPPFSLTDATFHITAGRPGTLRTRMRLETDSAKLDVPVDLRTWSGTSAAASVEPDYAEAAVLESEDARVDVSLRGGRLRVTPSPVGRSAIEQDLGQAGPPFVGFLPRPPHYPARVEETADGTALVQAGPAAVGSGLSIERVVTLVGGAVVRVVHRVRNLSDQPAPARVLVRSEMDGVRSFVAPTQAGIVNEPFAGFGGFPEGDTDVKPEGTDLPEAWVASEQDGAVVGLAWHGTADLKMPWGAQVDLTFDLGDVPAGAVAETPALYIVTGPGTWRTVRGWWRRLVQSPDAVEDRQPDAVRILDVAPPTAPAILSHDNGLLDLQVLSRRAKATSGPLRLSGVGLSVDPVEVEVPPIDRSAPFTVPAHVSGLEGPGAGAIDAAWQTDEAVDHWTIPVWRPAAAGCRMVCREEDGVHVVDNGWMALRVAPGFNGSAVAMERGGVNHLDSAWPTARPREWDNPWFGGIHPTFQPWGFDHRWGQPVEFGPIERRGARGLEWSGVRACWSPEHRDLRWVRFEVEYLMAAGSSVVAVVTRWRNLCSARMDAWGGVGVWTQPGGTGAGTVAHWVRGERRRERRPGGWAMVTASEQWVAAENEATGDCVLLASPDRAFATTVLHEGGGARHLFAEGPLTLERGAVRERLVWVALCSSVQGAERLAAALVLARELP